MTFGWIVSVELACLAATGLAAANAPSPAAERASGKHRPPLSATVLSADAVGADAAVGEDIVKALERAGFSVERQHTDGRTPWQDFDPGRLLVLPHGSLDVVGHDGLKTFLAKRGRLMVIGERPFQERVLNADGRRSTSGDLDRQRLEAARACRRNTPGVTCVEAFAEGEGQWRLFMGQDDTSQAHVSVVPPGPVGTAPSLQCRTGPMEKWFQVKRQFDASPLPPGISLTTFWAKGSGNTTQLCIDWFEKDGSRWHRYVPLSEQWRFYTIHSADLHFRQHAKVPGRGGKGDVFDPEDASGIAFSLDHHCVPAGGTTPST